jgi:hypothetical protein
MVFPEPLGARVQRRPEVLGSTVGVTEQMPCGREFVSGGNGVRVILAEPALTGPPDVAELVSHPLQGLTAAPAVAQDAGLLVAGEEQVGVVGREEPAVLRHDVLRQRLGFLGLSRVAQGRYEAEADAEQVRVSGPGQFHHLEAYLAQLANRFVVTALAVCESCQVGAEMQNASPVRLRVAQA